jgi:hypothetical protein
MLRASIARYARDSGRASASEVESWLRGVERSIEKQEFMFVLPQFVARGTKT